MVNSPITYSSRCSVSRLYILQSAHAQRLLIRVQVNFRRAEILFTLSGVMITRLTVFCFLDMSLVSAPKFLSKVRHNLDLKLQYT